MRKVRISGYGTAVPENIVYFDGKPRFRMREEENLLDFIPQAVEKALFTSGLSLCDIDLIVGATATPLQFLPCNAALILERLGGNIQTATFDINSSCTSFLTALDLVSYLVDTSRYRNVLLVSGDSASKGLNPRQKESYELFSDATTAVIVSSSQEHTGVLYAAQRTWTECAHDTEIRGGGSLLSAFQFTDSNQADFLFDMQGLPILRFSLKHLPPFIKTCMEKAHVAPNDIAFVIPHQASPALDLIMPKLGFPKGSYVNRVDAYGNMISASIPYILCKLLEEQAIQKGQKVLMMGTAAGLTVNFLLFQF